MPSTSLDTELKVYRWWVALTDCVIISLSNEASRVSYVRDTIALDVMDLSNFSFDVAEEAVATVWYDGCVTLTDSVYGRPGSQHVWDPLDLIAVYQRYIDIIMLHGYFKARHCTCGTSKADIVVTCCSKSPLSKTLHH